MKLLPAISLLTLLSALWACKPEAQGAGESGGGDSQIDIAVPDKEGYSVKGVVYADGKPLSGVIVSDGTNVTMTDFDGMYWLRSSSGEDVTWVSVPSGYRIRTNGWAPKFWNLLDHEKIAAGTVQRFDYSLSSENQSRFRLVVFTDTHIRGVKASKGTVTRMDSLIFRDNFVAPMRDMAEQEDIPVYGIGLGDMVQDSYVSRGTGLPEYKKCIRNLPFPVFHIPGNHDYDGVQYETFADEDSRVPKQYWIRHMGPDYYSFEIGQNHFIMLNGTRMTGGGANIYKNHVSSRQYEWMRKDLARVSGKEAKGLVICCHQPFFTYSAGENKTGAGCLPSTNRDSLLSLAAGFSRVTILSGHQHYSDILNTSKYSAPVTQYTHTSVHGAFYRSKYSADGAPCGYTLYDFDGASFTREHKALFPEVEYQAKAYSDGTVSAANPDIKCTVINIPAFEQGWSIEVTEDGVKRREASRVSRTDPGYEAECEQFGFTTVLPHLSSHIFEYIPKDASANVKITVKDSQGNEYRL